MQTTVVFSILLVTVLSANKETCSEVKPIQRSPSSANGRWYLVTALRQDRRDKGHMKSESMACGDFRNEPTCFCIGYDINSTMMGPFTPEYNLSSFSFDKMTKNFTTKSYMMQVADKRKGKEIFTIEPKDGGEKIVLTILATDDYQSFILLHVCNNHAQAQDIWLLSKTTEAPEESMPVVKETLMENKINMSQLFKVDQEECGYPPVSKANKAMTFVYL